jgi:hypothetical protein
MNTSYCDPLVLVCADGEKIQYPRGRLVRTCGTVSNLLGENLSSDLETYLQIDIPFSSAMIIAFLEYLETGEVPAAKTVILSICQVANFMDLHRGNTSTLKNKEDVISHLLSNQFGCWSCLDDSLRSMDRNMNDWPDALFALESESDLSRPISIVVKEPYIIVNQNTALPPDTSQHIYVDASESDVEIILPDLSRKILKIIRVDTTSHLVTILEPKAVNSELTVLVVKLPPRPCYHKREKNTQSNITLMWAIDKYYII